MNKQNITLIVIAVLVIGIGTFLAIKYAPNTQEVGQAVDVDSLIRDNSHSTGSKTAKVRLVEFGDFQCPGCGAFHTTTKEVLESYKSNPDFSFIFRNFPLISIHQNAELSANYAEAAGGQGKFFEMHNLLYESQTVWSNLSNDEAEKRFQQFAASLGLNLDTIKADLSTYKYKEVIKADLADGTKNKVDSTPSLFLNGTKLSGIPSAEQLKILIDEALKK